MQALSWTIETGNEIYTGFECEQFVTYWVDETYYKCLNEEIDGFITIHVLDSGETFTFEPFDFIIWVEDDFYGMGEFH